ncbi:MAG TPA: exopolysaccharide biosynthesis polyprenyl glycosylphosphotransferase [Gemmatimonadaceae bacterium]|nr:exopolysaccharide biosynthesis polyprenyl glycosylphosphotransferase [Gemmatimonadaceae bacterium]
MAKRSSLANHHHLRLTSAPGNHTPAAFGASPLRTRTRLRERRPVSVKRHSARIATRFGVLLMGDIAAIIVCELLSAVAAQSSVLGRGIATQFSRALEAGYGAGFNFGLAVIASLIITGNYSRHRRLNGRLRLLAASSLASAVLLWGVISSGNLLGAVAVYLVTGSLTWIVLLVERMATEKFLSTVWPGARGAAPAVLVTDRKEDSLLLERAVIGAGGDYSLAGYVPVGRTTFDKVLGGIRDLPEIIDEHHVEAVVVCQHLTDQQIMNVREASLAAGCQLLYPARAVKIAGVRPALVWHQDQPFFELGAPVLKASAVITKRIVDLVGASLGLILLSPVLLLIALAVKFDSPGSVFFNQDRAGLGGRKFRMLKFRTMRDGADAEKDGLSHLNHSGDSRLFKIPEDPRVTRLGALLRRWSLDELPQFWNVLRGDMSLVGPRPFFEADFASYQDHHFRRLDAKPGITGLWQVSGRSSVVDFEDVVYLDRQYIEQWSPWLDISIMFRTLPAVVRRTGAY